MFRQERFHAGTNKPMEKHIRRRPVCAWLPVQRPPWAPGGTSGGWLGRRSLEGKITGELPARPVKIGQSGFGTGQVVDAECEFRVLKSLAQPVTFLFQGSHRQHADRAPT